MEWAHSLSLGNVRYMFTFTAFAKISLLVIISFQQSLLSLLLRYVTSTIYLRLVMLHWLEYLYK